MSVRLKTAPTVEPVSLEDMKEHLHVDSSDHDDRISALIAVARQKCEGDTGRACLTQTWELSLDEFPKETIDLPFAPLQSITSVEYTDTDGAEQTLDAATYQVDTITEPGRLALAPGYDWPDTEPNTLGAVTVTYVAGWTTAAQVPALLVHAIKLLVAHWFENLEAVTMDGTPKVLPMGVTMLLNMCLVPSVG